MTPHPPILRNSALSLPLVIIAGFVIDQPTGIAASVSGVFILFNLWLYSVLAPRLVTAIARQEPVAVWVAALVAKTLLAVGLVWAMLHWLVPEGVALGFLPLMLGTLATGVQLARATPDAPVAAPTPTSEA